MSQNDKTQKTIKTCGCHQREALEWQNGHQKPRYLQAQTSPQLDGCRHKTIRNRRALGCQLKPSFAKKLAQLEARLSSLGAWLQLCVKNHEVKTTAKPG